MKIECENKFCTYYENNECVLNSVSLDELGICKQAFLIEIDEELLILKRKRFIKKFEKLEI